MKYCDMPDNGAKRRAIKHASYLKHKETEALRNNIYRTIHKDHIRKKIKEWTQLNPEKVRAAQLRNRKKNVAKRTAWTREWRKRHPERSKAIAHRCRIKNIEKIKAATKAYYWATREKRIQNVSLWRKQNPEKVKASRKRYIKKYPEKIRLNSINARHSRYRRISNSEHERIRIRNEDVKNIRERQKNKCYWCGTVLESKYHLDHIWPLAKGGSHKIINLAITCPPCNWRKGSKTPIEFAGRLF